MVMQLCTGRELFDHMYKDGKVFEEDEVKHFIRSLLRAVSYLHSNCITVIEGLGSCAEMDQHRDLKLENLLLETDSESASLKVCDFGFSKYIKRGERLTKSLGTVDYVAPEVILGDYNEV